jgi:hypothetical protein
MSELIFSAAFTPNASIQLTTNTFQVSATIYDFNGVFSGFDVTVGNIVFLDTFGSVTSPYTVSRYIVSSINSLNLYTVNLVLTYDDTGAPIDPGEVIGIKGFIAKPSNDFKLAYHAAAQSQGISSYVVEYARNYEAFNIIDPNLGGGGGGGSSNEELFTNVSGSTIAALIPVRQDSNGDIFTIDPSNESQVNSIVGITKQSIPNNVEALVVLSGLIKNITTSFSIGDVIFLSKTGTLTSTAPDIGVGGFVEGDFVVRLGKITKNSDNPSAKDLLVSIQVIGGL